MTDAGGFPCPSCGRAFSTRGNMARHARRRCGVSPERQRPAPRRAVCPHLCGASFYFRAALLRHLAEHEAPADAVERRAFASRDAFLAWRRAEELRLRCHFAKARSQAAAGGRVEVFACAAQAADGGRCPAQLRAVTDAGGAVDAALLARHAHAPAEELAPRRLEPGLQARVAADLSAGLAPARLAAHYARHGTPESGGQPLLLSARQVELVRQRANRGPRPDAEPAAAAAALLLRWRHLPSASPEARPRVLFHAHDGLVFRQQLLLPPLGDDCCPQSPGAGVLEHLPREVTVAALQSPRQAALLRQAAGRLLAVDTVHCAEDDGDWFVLALCVPLEMDAGPPVGRVVRAAPVAFLVGNHLSEEILQELLAAVASGPDAVRPPLVVTDTSNRGLAAARAVFGGGCGHRVGTWRTLLSWRRQLCLDTRCHAVARPLLARLLALQQEPDGEALTSGLRRLEAEFEPVCPQFVAGLRERYASAARLPEWAAGARPGPALDAAARVDRLMFAEPLHLRFALFFSQAPRRRRPDALLRLVADACADADRPPADLPALGEHARAAAAVVTETAPGRFLVRAAGDDEEQEVATAARVCPCPARCFRVCPHLLCAGLCAHLWACACPASGAGLCRHVHAVQMRLVRIDLARAIGDDAVDACVARSDASLTWSQAENEAAPS